MKIKFWICFALSLLVPGLFFITGCIQTTTQTNSSPETTIKPVSDVPSIDTPEAYALIQKNTGNPDFIILDVRTPDEFNNGHIANAVLIDYYSPEFKSNISKLDKDKQYLVYCRTDNRSTAAVRLMLDLGFREVQNLIGGIEKWIQDGYPTVK